MSTGLVGQVKPPSRLGGRESPQVDDIVAHSPPARNNSS